MRLFSAGSVTVLAFTLMATPHAAQAQEVPSPNPFNDGTYNPFRVVADIEAQFAAVETARLSGDCARRDAELAELRGRLAPFIAPGSTAFTPEARAEWVTRLAEMAARPCPPTSADPTPKPVTKARPEGALRTVTLDDLRIALAAACGDAFEGARQRLLAGLDRAIRFERDAGKREALQRDRARIAALPKTPCTTTPPPATRLGDPVEQPSDENARMKQRARVIGEIDDDLAKAESARLAGNCPDRELFLDRARFLLGAFVTGTGLFSPEASEAIRDRIEAAGQRPCPPPGDRRTGDSGRRQSDAELLANASFADKATAFLTLLYASKFLPRVGVGVRRDGPPGGAPERFAGETPRRVNQFGISGGFQTKIAAGFNLRAELRYASGDASADIATPASTAQTRVDTGIVYGRLSNGSSGIIAGFGSTGRTKVEATDFEFNGAVGMSAAEVFAEAQGFRIEIGFDYAHSERRHDLSIASSGISGGFTFNFAQSRLQQLDEDYFGLSTGLEFALPVSKTTDGGLTFSGRINIGPYFRDTRFRGTERNTANFGPMGNRDITLDFAEDKSAWGGRFKSSTALEYRLKGGITLTVGGGVDYLSDVGAVVNPNSGDQLFFLGQTTRIERADLFSWRAGGGLRIPF